MLDESIADGWFSLSSREESILEDLVRILQSDQQAVASARAEAIEENVRRKEAVFEEMRLLEESKKIFLASFPEEAEGFAGMATHFPESCRARSDASLSRLRSLREAAVELNELSRRIMIHGLFLVRSTLAAMTGGAGDSGYAGNGGLQQRASTGRIVRQNV
jgi:flagellar biosynthesis/type III secretory pathway chaperone